MLSQTGKHFFIQKIQEKTTTAQLNYFTKINIKRLLLII